MASTPQRIVILFRIISLARRKLKTREKTTLVGWNGDDDDVTHVAVLRAFGNCV